MLLRNGARKKRQRRRRQKWTKAIKKTLFGGTCDMCPSGDGRYTVVRRMSKSNVRDEMSLCCRCRVLYPWSLLEQHDVVMTKLLQALKGPCTDHCLVRRNWSKAMQASEEIRQQVYHFLRKTWYGGLQERATPVEQSTANGFVFLRPVTTQRFQGWSVGLFRVSGEQQWIEGIVLYVSEQGDLAIEINCDLPTVRSLFQEAMILWQEETLS